MLPTPRVKNSRPCKTKVNILITNIAGNTPDATQLLPDFYPAVRVAEAKDGAPFYTAKTSAHKYPQWQPNDHDTLCVLVVDIDRDNWILPFWEMMKDYPELSPSWVIEKSSNGHGQLGWIINHVATGENARRHPIRYANAVRYALTQAFDGDENFVNSRCWNPLWDGWNAGAGDSWLIIPEPRPLGVLRDALQKAGLWVTEKYNRRPSAAVDINSARGRNDYIFNTARQRSRGSVAEAAHAINDALAVPLSLNELNGIIRSIERFEAVNGPPWDRTGSYSLKYMDEEELERQRERGRRGGLVNSVKQQEARALGPQAAGVIRSAKAIGNAVTALDLQQKGFTRKEIAEKMDVHPGTVKKWLRQARKMLAESSNNKSAERMFEPSL